MSSTPGVIVGIVLAAGLSRRMGQRKLLLPLDGTPIVRWSVDAVRREVDRIVAVVGPGDAEVRAALGDLPVTFAINPHPEDGQGASISCGIAALDATVRAVVVALGDQPRLPSGVIPSLRRAFERTGKAIVAPVYRGTQGTPVLFSAAVFPELRALTGDAGARSVVRRERSRVELVPFDLPMPLDVDTPEDYAKLV
jgi:molybdenum cofactor cytidylyltransferase